MDINENMRFVFVKDFKMDGGTIKTGSELSLVHGCLYLDGGLLPSFYQQTFMRLIDREMKNGYEYLKRKGVIYNKI